jgi:hypothetical protein
MELERMPCGSTLSHHRQKSRAAERDVRSEDPTPRRTTYISHELFARYPDVLRQRGTEHHYLLVMRCRAEDLLNVAVHI